jgi:hypothetical protein
VSTALEAVAFLLVAAILFGAAVRIGIIVGARLDRFAERLAEERRGEPDELAGDPGNLPARIGRTEADGAARPREGSGR